MTLHIDSQSRLVNDQEQNLALQCPHCDVTAHLTLSAVPTFEDLQAHKPKFAGLVYRCDACTMPVFLRFSVRMYSAARVELSPQYVEVERPREKFTFAHLPENVEALFKEALVCFSSGAFNAFASMARRTAQAAFEELGEVGKLRLFDELNRVREMADLDTATFLKIRSMIFSNEGDPRLEPPMLDTYEAAVALEVMKDLLYEAYVRKGRLQQAMMVRRYFADETGKHKVMSIMNAGT